MAASEKREVPTIDPDVEPEFVGVHSALTAEQCENWRGEHVEDVERCDRDATHTMVVFDGSGVKEIASCDGCGEPGMVELGREWSGELVDGASCLRVGSRTAVELHARAVLQRRHSRHGVRTADVSCSRRWLEQPFCRYGHRPIGGRAMMDSEEAIEHEAWKDVSDNTGYNYHWHNTLVETEDTAEYRSIRLADEDEETLASLRGSGWTIELYPDPDNDGHMSRWRFEGDSAKEEAFEKVRELMEEYKDP